MRRLKTPGLLALLRSCYYFERKGRPFPEKLRGDVSAWQENRSWPSSSATWKGPRGDGGTARVTPVPVGSVLVGAAMVWSVTGREVVPFFHYKRNFLGLAGLV